ncbi:MAG TPA: endonuclease VIII [Sedimenticola sp.]|nr:endonuclease VIII [Sedimenticola sp.]
MPEGPEIRRAADAVEQALGGHLTTAVWFGLTPLKRFEPILTGVEVRAVETRGKALLTRFANGLTIYSHNQLYGRWYILPAGDSLETGRQLRLAIRNEAASALLYSASEIQVLSEPELAAHPFLKRLGPDLLAPDTTPGLLLERLQSKTFRGRQLGSLLTDQSFVAGLGNYLRCEILFSAGMAPSLRPRECAREALDLLAREMLRLPRQSYETGGITNDPVRARQMLAAGARFEQARFQVFRRAGLPCYRCGRPVLNVKRGGQPCYLCPGCQGG